MLREVEYWKHFKTELYIPQQVHSGITQKNLIVKNQISISRVHFFLWFNDSRREGGVSYSGRAPEALYLNGLIPPRSKDVDLGIIFSIVVATG